MSKEKQIEEICKILTEAAHKACEDIPFAPPSPDDRCIRPNMECHRCKEARALIDAGYRKQSESVTDINVGSKSEWISVEERLPEENGRYLVCVNISHLAFENLTAIAIMAYGISHGFYLYNENEKVTHWMPLPEAPKMRKEDEGK